MPPHAPGRNAPLLLLAPVLLLGGACGLTGNPQGPDSSAPRPNVVLLVADDLGWGELGFRGHPHLSTPALDALAADGLSLERFYAAAPVCSPTRASLLTGGHPNRCGVFAWGHDLPPEEVTLAEALQDAGYLTGLFGKWHLGSVRAGDATSPGAQGFDHWLASPNFFDLDAPFSREGQVVASEGEGSAVIVDAAGEFIERSVAAGRPFFALVTFGSPHVPHEALDADLAPHAERNGALARYYAEIEAMDRAVGDLRAGLRELGIEQDTLVWFLSDNGPRPPRASPDARVHATGGLRGEKGTLLEGGLRVPSLLSWPAGLAAGARDGSVSGTVDVLPTLLELAGATPRSTGGDGESLVPLLRGKVFERSAPLGFWFHPSPGRAVFSDRILRALEEELAAGPPRRDVSLCGPPPVGDVPLAARRGPAAWVDGRWKLLRPAGEAGLPGPPQLYDLIADPAEERDLAQEEPGRAARLAADLEAWQRAVVAGHDARP